MGFALAFDVNGIMLRVTTVRELNVAPYTVLGWQVDDIEKVAGQLRDAGVQLERYPGLPQDEQGIWDAPGGAPGGLGSKTRTGIRSAFRSTDWSG